MLPRSRPNGEAPGKRTPSDAREVHGVADLRESAVLRPSWLVFATSARAAPFFERQLLEGANKPTEVALHVAEGINQSSVEFLHLLAHKVLGGAGGDQLAWNQTPAMDNKAQKISILPKSFSNSD
jgi:hypothetical protein